MILQENSKIKEYYERTAKEYDSFFENSERDGLVQKVAHALFRKPYVYKRMKTVIEMMGDIKGKSVLDCGCGNGRYTVEMAKMGGIVTGVDFSKAMLEIAKNYATKNGVDIKFIEDDISNLRGKYDIVVASGVFDYVENSEGLLLKLRELAKDFIVLTYPKLFNIQVPFRKIWLMKRGVPVHFYTKKYFDSLFEKHSIRKDVEVDIGPLVVKKGWVS